MLQKIRKLQSLLNTEGLKARVLKGGLWLTVGGSSEQALRLLRNMILARILAPEAFGVMAIILAVNATLETFTEVGIQQAIIQNQKSEEDTYLNGAWWFSFARSVVLLILGVISSYWIADFYNIKQSLFLLQISFITILFNGAVSSRAYIALKKMEYRKWVIMSNGGGAIGIITAIVFSFIYPGVVALVIGFVTEAAARLILSYAICPFIPKIRFSNEHLKELFAFSRGMFGLPILAFIYSQAGIFVIGKLLGKTELGLYSMAFSLAQAPTQFLTKLMNQILMPAFSSKQENMEWINQTILKTTRLIVFLGIPLGTFAGFYSRDILLLVYGSQYAKASMTFAILFFATLLSTFSIPMVNVYLALGQPRLHRLFTGIRAVVIVILIYPAVKLSGLTGAAIAALFSMIISYLFQVSKFHGLTNLDTLQYYRIFFNAILISLAIPAVWVGTNNVFSQNPLINLITGLTVCCFIYGLGGIIYRRKINKAVIPNPKRSTGNENI